MYGKAIILLFVCMCILPSGVSTDRRLRDSLIVDYFLDGYPYQLILFPRLASRLLSIFEAAQKNFAAIKFKKTPQSLSYVYTQVGGTYQSESYCMVGGALKRIFFHCCINL